MTKGTIKTMGQAIEEIKAMAAGTVELNDGGYEVTARVNGNEVHYITPDGDEVITKQELIDQFVSGYEMDEEVNIIIKEVSKMLDIRAIVKDEAVINCILTLGAVRLNKPSVTIEEVEEAYNNGHPEIREDIDYIIFDEA